MLHRKDLNVPSFEPSWSCCRPKSFKESCTHTSLSLHTTVIGHFTRHNFERWSYFYFSRLSEAASSVTKLQLKLRLQTGSVFKVVTPTCTERSVRAYLIPRKTDKFQQLERPCRQHGDHLWGHFKVRAAATTTICLKGNQHDLQNDKWETSRK